MKKNTHFEMDLCSGSIVKKVISFSVPLMLTGILQLLYNAADIIVVGQYTGKVALAAVGSTGSLINLLINIFMGLSVGTSVVVAQQYGAGNHKAVHEAVHTSMALALICGFAVGTLGYVSARPLLLWMGSPADVIEGATLYIRIYFIGMPANMLYTFGSAILRAVGDTRRPLAFLTVAGIINIILNLISVIVFHMGVAGVAIATIVSQAVSAVLVVRCLMRASSSIHFNPRQMRLYDAALKHIAKIGLPAGIQGSLFSISNVLIQSSINSFGSVVMAGCAAASNLEGFVYTSMNSISQATLSFVGQNHGAGQYRRVRKTLWVCLGLVAVAGLAVGGLFLLFSAPLIGVYNADPEVIRQGMIRLSIICPLYFLCGMMEVVVCELRGLGYSLFPTIVTLLGVCGLRILWLYTVFASTPTLEVLLWSYPLTWIITLFFHMITYGVIQRKVPREDKPMPVCT